MADLLIRRRLMIPQDEILPEWDLEWVSHDDGYPTTKGFTLWTNGSGTGSISLTDYYTKITAKNSYEAAYHLPYFDTTPQKIVCEAKMKIGTSSQGGCYLQVSNATSASNYKSIRVRVQHSTNYKGIYVYDTGTSLSTATKLQSASLDTLYTLKVIVDGDYADIYVNDVLKSSHIDLSTTTNTSVTARSYVSIGGQGTGSSNTPTYLREFRMKINRL